MDIRLIKLVSGETVMGSYDSESKMLKEVVMVQTIPTNSGMQIALLPYGFPYEQDITAAISEKHFLYEYTKVPEEMKSRYIESKSNIKIAPAGALNPKDGGGGLIL